MYKSAQLDLAPLETRCLLHLTTLLPGDALSEKVKDYLIEKMRLTPNIQSLEEIFAYILLQEGYDYARRNTHDKANKIHRLDEGDGGSPGKEYKYKICDKKHARGAGTYWQKFPHIDPGYKRDRSLSGKRKKPAERDGTPHYSKDEKPKKSRRSRSLDNRRDSSFEASESEETA